jgi:RNA polymerase sigma factor (sigma-70 family)
MKFRIYGPHENDLIEGCRRGDRKAQELLYQRYASRMYGVCLRYTRDPMEAEDIVVVAFTRAFSRIDQFRGDGSFEGWLRRITVNEALGVLRKNRTMGIETDLDSADREVDYSYLNDHLEAEDLIHIIEQLPPGYRVVFNMYAIDGYSHKEIADALGISENTSKSQLSRARALLQKLLAESGWDREKKTISYESTT